jgi:fimbrial isopeptide formation D2 family protein/LPXTG-motif cell wall-anchored protein
MKKIIALVLALAMVLVVGASFAAGSELTPVSTDTGSISITTSTNTVSVAGRTFHAFRVLDATIATVNGNPSVAYTVPSYMRNFFDSQFATELTGKTYPSAAYDTAVTTKIGTYTSDSASFFTFAEALQTYCKTNVDYYEATGAANATSVTFDHLPLGYYIVADMTTAGDSSNVSAVILDTTMPDASIVVKASSVPEDKYITGVNTGEEGEANQTTHLYDDDNDNLNEVSDVSIGDIIHFRVDSAVPDVRGYNAYKFVVDDTLDKGLGLDTSTVRVTIGTGNDAVVYLAPDDLTVTTEKDQDTDATKLHIVLKGALAKFTGKTDQPIAITYDAELTSEAAIGTAIENDVAITYSNNPNFDYDGTKDDFEPTEPHGITPHHKTKTFTTEITVRKVDQDGKPLSNVEFTLTGKVAHNVLEYYEKFVEDNTDGQYYRLNDGTYTTSAPGSTDPVTGKTFDSDAYESTTTKYKLVHDEYVTSQDENTAKKVVATTGANGTITFTGLSEGTYTITETGVPDGYTGVDPINVNITFRYDTRTSSWKFFATGADPDGDNTFTVSVVNKTGVELPSTGGIGTTIFYILGGLLVVGAAVILVARRKAQD